MSDLISDLTLLSRLDMTTELLETRELDFFSLINQVYEQLKVLAKQKNISLLFPLEQKIVFKADYKKIEKMIYNLLANAIKYGNNDGWVRIDAIQNNGETKIVVEDNGMGISKKDLPLIFQRFYRAEKSRSRDTGGSGLGLAIVKYVVDLHQGTIDVDSKLGKGTKFVISLPSLP